MVIPNKKKVRRKFGNDNHEKKVTNKQTRDAHHPGGKP